MGERENLNLNLLVHISDDTYVQNNNDEIKYKDVIKNHLFQSTAKNYVC